MTPAEQVREALVTDAMVQAALDAWFNKAEWRKFSGRASERIFPDMRAAISAALAALAPAADEVLLKVRWEETSLGWSCYIGETEMFAGNVFQFSGTGLWTCTNGRFHSSNHPTRAAACDALVQKIRGG